MVGETPVSQPSSELTGRQGRQAGTVKWPPQLSPTCPRSSRDIADTGRCTLNAERKCGVSAKEMLWKTRARKKGATGAARWTQAPTISKVKTPPPGGPLQGLGKRRAFCTNAQKAEGREHLTAEASITLTPKPDKDTTRK